VTVTTAAGTSGTLSADLYSYDPQPTVTGVDPNSGPTAGGNTITLTGSGSRSAARVTFGTVTAGSVIAVSDSQLTAVAPPGATSTVNVRVTTPGGVSTASVNDLYVYSASTKRADRLRTSR
jgi:hypothetical protein